MAQENHLKADCYYCGKTLEGELLDSSAVMDAVAQDSKNKSIGILCLNCRTAFCYDHKKELGFKIWDGYDRAACPQCGNKLKEHQNIVHMVKPATGKTVRGGKAPASVSSGSQSPLAEVIRDLGAKGQYLDIIPRLSKNSISLDVENALREVFAGCDDEQVMASLAGNLQSGPSSASGVFSGTALCFIKTPRAVHYLMKAFRKGSGFGSSINEVSLNGVVKNALMEIGEPGLGQMLVEMEERGQDGRIPAYICEAIKTFLGPDNWEPAVKALNMRSYYGREALAKTLQQAGWQPQSDQHKAVLLIAQGNQNGLEKMGPACEPALIETLGLDDPGFIGISPFKKLIGVLGKIGSADAVDPLLQLLGEGKYARQVVEALGAIGDPRAAKAILEHAQNAKGLKSLKTSAYVNALAKMGTGAIPLLESALTGDKKVRKIAEKALGMIR